MFCNIRWKALGPMYLNKYIYIIIYIYIYIYIYIFLFRYIGPKAFHLILQNIMSGFVNYNQSCNVI